MKSREPKDLSRNLGIDMCQSLITLVVYVFAFTLFALFVPRAVNAAVFSCSSGNVACLVNAINTANGNGVADTINLDGSTFTLTAVDNDTGDGPNGLPDITSNITINGDGSIIERSSADGTPEFRIFHVSEGGNLTLNDLTVQNGLTPGGSGIGGGVPGGGIFNNGILTLTNGTVSGNNTGSGGCERFPQVGTDCGNGGSGGGIFNNGILTLTNSTVSGNQASPGGSGGGIFNGGTLTVTNSTFSGNSAIGGDGDFGQSVGSGGGIENFGTATVINSTFSGNTAGSGGGIINGGTLTVTNSTFSGNSLSTCFGGSGGGGIANGGTLTITNSTLSGNSVSSCVSGPGGGIANFGTATLLNTIIANSPSGGDCAGTLTDGGYNIDDDGTCNLSTANHSQPNANPQLDPAGLKDNGGPTQTIALCTGTGTPTGCSGASPAIDVIPEGTNGCGTTITTDQRGVTRPQDGNNDGIAACDIGAFEVIGNIIIGGCNTGVLDQPLGNGLDISDQINECAVEAKNHGQFVSCVSHLTNGLKKAGIITDTQKGAIQSCAGRANIP